MGKTTIEWTDVSWPITNGCRRASPGCEHCYAERLASTRLKHHPKYKGLAVFDEHGPRWTGKARPWPPELTMPLRLRKPSRIFVADMGDLFYEKVPDEFILQVFHVIRQAHRHTYQVLTKRAERMRDFCTRLRFDAGSLDGREGGLYLVNGPEIGDVKRDPEMDRLAPCYGFTLVMRNLWLGVSVENQKYADERIPKLLATPTRTRFVSLEPQLETIDLGRFLAIGPGIACECDALGHKGADRCGGGWIRCNAGLRRLDWVIQGGESGKGACRFDLSWARDVRHQCQAAGVPYFLKQVGPKPYESVSEKTRGMGGIGWPVKHRKGGNPDEWPEDLRVREFPEVRP